MATHKDIARVAGVSTATVSRVLAESDYVRPELVERVRRAAQSLSYRGNRAARALRKQKSEAIGLVVSDVENPFFASIARAVESVAAAHRHAVLLCNTDEDLTQEDLYIDLLVSEQVAGVIITPSTEQLGPLTRLLDAGIPTVALDRRVQGNPFDTVLVDNVAGAKALISDLLEHGHRRIGAIMGTTVATPSRERLAGCRGAIDRVRGASLFVGEGELKAAVGISETMELAGKLALDMLASSEPPTAFFCANAILSQGTLFALKRAGRRVPDEIALVGFDDLPAFALLDPPLTVAAQPIEELGRSAASLLFRRIAEPDRKPEIIVLPPELRWRDSCGGHRVAGEMAARQRN